MAVRASELAGNIAGRLEFLRERYAQAREDRHNARLPQEQQQLSSSDLLKTIDFSEVNGNPTEHKPGLIDSNGLLYVINGKKGDTPVLARDYWSEHGMPENAVKQLVDEEGDIRFQLAPSTHRRLIGHNPQKAAFMTIDAIAPLYDNNQYPLRGSISTIEQGRRRGIDGFNAHQRPHIRTVTHGTDALLDQAQQIGFRKISRNTLVAALRGVAWHDSANILSRRLHAKGGPLLMSHVAPLSQEDPLLDRVNAVIVFHNEAEMVTLLKANGADTAKKGIEFLSRIDPGILAAIMADKLHIGQDRLPPEWKDPKGILRDIRVGFNACFTVDGAGYTQDGKRFKVNISYNPRVETEIFTPYTGRHPAVVDSKRHTNGITDMPEAIDTYLQNPNVLERVSHSEVMEAIMWDSAGHGDSLKLAIMSAFAFNPWLQQVEFNINDPDAPIGLGEHPDKGLPALLPPERIKEVQHRQYIFTRDNIDDQLKAIRQKFADKGVNVEALIEAGKELRPPAPVPAA